MGSKSWSASTSANNNFQNNGAAHSNVQSIANSNINGGLSLTNNVEVLDYDTVMRSFEFLDDGREFLERQTEAGREFQNEVYSNAIADILTSSKVNQELTNDAFIKSQQLSAGTFDTLMARVLGTQEQLFAENADVTLGTVAAVQESNFNMAQEAQAYRENTAGLMDNMRAVFDKQSIDNKKNLELGGKIILGVVVAGGGLYAFSKRGKKNA